MDNDSTPIDSQAEMERSIQPLVILHNLLHLCYTIHLFNVIISIYNMTLIYLDYSSDIDFATGLEQNRFRVHDATSRK